MAESITHDQIAEFKEAFSLFDKDGDGIISTKDLGSVLRAVGQNLAEEELQDMIKEIDHDGSHTMDFAEFLTLMARAMYSNTAEERLLQAFQVLDDNQDGYITAEELREVMSSFGETLTEAEVEYMMKEADVDGDGRIDYKEFCAVMLAK
eukprot:CAMPEP_0201498216 /NCGR_PEP_ID=MMETSP0151_2-20130828/69987_1 /ASSEMBLY_ACC=CAM_ASM_000257 /TAXON_ID=200890 /ORGANISM="Paramoeba atlantica, Strain 621/1 / CCAP 1560/9" /LENGTH=149 /DNA_ID=CAMNT_0047889641 /DNA_START=45 /DNA_END=494 /DNA_ORIENTATION=-